MNLVNEFLAGCPAPEPEPAPKDHVDVMMQFRREREETDARKLPSAELRAGRRVYAKLSDKSGVLTAEQKHAFVRSLGLPQPWPI